MHQSKDSGDGHLLEGERLTELRLHLMRTRGVWQVPHLDARSSLDILALQPPGSFLVTGFGLSLALTMNTDPHPEAMGTFRILETPTGVALQGSQLSFSDLPELLAFLSTSRDILPQPLLLLPRSMGPGVPLTEPLQIGMVWITSVKGALSVVNPLYLRDHGPWEPKEGDSSEPVQKDALAPQPLGPHRVSWIEGPPSPETEPEAWSLYSLEGGEDKLVEADEAQDEGDEDSEPGDGVYQRVQALAQARGSLVAKQHRALQARLREARGGPCGPEAGDPATELLQDIRHLLTDLKDHLVNDPEVQAAYRARMAPPAQDHEDLEAMVEAAVCWVVLRPLQPVLWTKLRMLRARDLQQLQWRQEVMRAWALQEAPIPSPTRHRIQARLAHLHTVWAPQRKVALLLAICRDVYEGLAQSGSQEPLGADDFLPALTEELLWSPDIEATQLDVEFLMEILDPAELLGETGYYLTTWFGALHHIAHFQPAVSGPAPKGLSYEARASIRLWQRRRTLHTSGCTVASPSMQLEKPWESLEEDKSGAEIGSLPGAAASFTTSDL
ncbi:ras and Rab interactor-like protein isoform X2 [Phascolarctos cinereus]|uniref:Ras and Rab interactor-like protein isoform X1 n=1 Tax=Phascolarctos cinereus TaxID=38626 RepID=A0A6P5JRS2_PHACI|nr:ras and Rab interactor-like protein isoform X1 [Phascolarctos cinereus]